VAQIQENSWGDWGFRVASRCGARSWGERKVLIIREMVIGGWVCGSRMRRILLTGKLGYENGFLGNGNAITVELRPTLRPDGTRRGTQGSGESASFAVAGKLLKSAQSRSKPEFCLRKAWFAPQGCYRVVRTVRSWDKYNQLCKPRGATSRNFACPCHPFGALVDRAALFQGLKSLALRFCPFGALEIHFLMRNSG
jgi:hypothetical protein